MLYRRFGRTNLQMPVFTCGGMRYQHSWKKTDKPTSNSIKRVENIVKRSLELGINHFDTANGYGTSEEELGHVLRNVNRDSFILQSKVPLREDTSLFMKMFNESMSLLQVDYLDMFSLHGINNHELLDIALKKNGCLDVALRLKREGRIKNIGFSTHGTVDVIIDTIESKAFDYVNLHWFYIFQDNWPAIIKAKKNDMGVLIISPNDKGGMLYKPPEKLQKLTSPLSPMKFNDIFCLSKPEVDTLTIGASAPETFDEHVDALRYLDHQNELSTQIEAKLIAEFRSTLGYEWAETWKDGLPKWYETPGNINIPTILFLWNIAKAYDMVEYSKMRFNLMGNGSHWFPGNRPENLDSYDFSECLRNAPNRKFIPGILKDAFELLAGKDVKRLGAH